MSHMKTLPQTPGRKAQPRGRAFADGVLLQLALPSDSSLLCVVRATVDCLAALLKCSDADCRRVTRAVDEAMTNILRHSYKGRRDQPIVIQFRQLRQAQDTGLEVLLWDEGPPIDCSKRRPRDFNQLRPGGLGLHFIRQAMDTVEFSRIGDANQLRLLKYTRGATAAAKL